MVTAGGRQPLPGASPAAGTRRGAAHPFLPGRARPAPHPGTRLPEPRRGSRAARTAAAPLRPPPGARRRPTPHRRPHLGRLPGTGARARSEAGRAKLLTGKARLPGARTGSWSRSPAPAPLSAARCGNRERAGLRSTRNRRQRRRQRHGFPGKKQTLAKTSLLNRPCCLPGGERQGRAAQPDTHLDQSEPP